jgi:hypothetical protein
MHLDECTDDLIRTILKSSPLLLFVFHTLLVGRRMAPLASLRPDEAYGAVQAREKPTSVPNGGGVERQKQFDQVAGEVHRGGQDAMSRWPGAGTPPGAPRDPHLPRTGCHEHRVPRGTRRRLLAREPEVHPASARDASSWKSITRRLVDLPCPTVDRRPSTATATATATSTATATATATSTSTARGYSFCGAGALGAGAGASLPMSEKSGCAPMLKPRPKM